MPAKLRAARLAMSEIVYPLPEETMSTTRTEVGTMSTALKSGDFPLASRLIRAQGVVRGT